MKLDPFFRLLIALRRTPLTALLALLVCSLAAPAEAQYAGWRQSGSLFILTSPEGADLPAAVSVEGFPLLVRLNKEWFDFTTAQPHGEDLRFAASDGVALPYQIEDWDAARGQASVWVRVPKILGNARQALRVFWGKADAAGESSGAAVFNDSNGYLSVWHMGQALADEVGTLTSRDVGTTPTAGIIGQARHFAGKQGVFGGDKIPNYPAGASSHTTEAWFRAERPNVTLIGWGNEGGGRGSKARMQLRSPPHIHIDSDFSDVNGDSRLPMGEWIHVAHTYSNGDGRIYINGKPDGAAKPALNIKTPARMWIGGWYNNYDFVGDMDEVRISKVARSADWVRLQYENQKPMQTLVGSIVQKGDAFSASPAELTVAEGKSSTITASAGGAQKVYWILKRDGRETVVAVDRFGFTFDAGRVVGDQTATLQFKVVYANQTRTKDVGITIKEDIEEPAFALKAPHVWDGRETIEVMPLVSNLAAMQAKGAGDLKYRWSVSGLAAIKEIAPDKLILRRSQNSGALTVTLALSNGGAEVSHSTTIAVNEPKHDEWIHRAPAKDEKPEDGQFYARDEAGQGTLIYTGTLTDAAELVFLKVYAGDKLIKNETQKPAPDKSYAFAARLDPGLVQYKTEFGTKAAAGETVFHTASNLLCGDAYIINGQSNAVANDFGKGNAPEPSQWIRTFGSTDGGPQGARLKLWGDALARSPGGKLEIGYWGMELGRRLVESQKIPICIINGAVGGTRIDMHQRHPDNPEDVATIYGRLLWRVRQARLTHGIRGILWHQGENDQGADGPTGGFGWETYRDYFIDLSAAWKQDYPNLQHYYLFQIWPKSCAMGVNGSDNMLREVQRTLPSYFSNMSIMSTLGIKPPGGCHFPAEGYAEFARLICPLVERDNYGKAFAQSIAPPNLKKASYASAKKDEITLEFDQPVIWNDSLKSQFYLDGVKGMVTSGAVAGNVITLKLTAATTAQAIAYLDSKSWSQENLLYGENGIAALTFCNVPILPGK